MSVHHVRNAQSNPPIPRPRPADSDDVVDAAPASEAMETEASASWSEPQRPALSARRRTEYWDVTTASWRSRR